MARRYLWQKSGLKRDAEFRVEYVLELSPSLSYAWLIGCCPQQLWAVLIIFSLLGVWVTEFTLKRLARDVEDPHVVMSSFDKTVKLACKPKAAPPKAKVRHIYWLLATTLISLPSTLTPSSQQRIPKTAPSTMYARHSRHDLENLTLLYVVHWGYLTLLHAHWAWSQIVYKALIVLHTMIRNGATDNVLSYLSSEDVLRLKAVSNGHWEGVLFVLLNQALIRLTVRWHAKVTIHPRTCRTTQYIWTQEYARTKTSNMTLCECKVNPTVMPESRARSSRLAHAGDLREAKRSWVENSVPWQLKRGCYARQRRFCELW